MARRKTERFWQKTPDVYARTSDTWTTRYYQRKQDPQFSLLGLNTAPDDFHKKEGSSPYLTNVRFMGEREEDQRAQVMSRKGARLVGSLGDEILDRQEEDGKAYLEVYEGKALEWEITHNKRLVGLSLHLQNFDKATGAVKITIRQADTKKEITNAVIDTALISENNFSQHRVRFIRAVSETRVVVRLEILDDVDDEEDSTELRDKRAVRVLSELDGRHRYATYELPNRNDALEEIPYTFTSAPLIPLTGTIINDWNIMVRSEVVRTGGQRHIVFPVSHDDTVELFKVNLVTEQVSLLTSMVSSEAKQVRFAQAEGYLYYVDGISPLRRVNLTTLVAEDVIPKASEITVPGVDPATLTAKAGASLIHFLDNRLYLSGYKDDPNLVLVSLIDATKPRFEQYNDRFYSPDQSPELSSGSPITALADISNYLIVFRLDGLSLYEYGAGVSASASRQQTPEGAQVGVANQEAVCQGKNNIYFYNQTEGIMRFGGSVNRVVSGDIENLLPQIKNPLGVFMVYHNGVVRVYCSFDGQENDRCLYYYSALEGKLPWYMDIDTPVNSGVVSTDSEKLYAMHSQTASVMEVDSQNTDFDSYIVLEYHTQYRIPPTSDPSGFTYVRRLHLHEFIGDTHSVFLALDIDHQDRPIVWRRYIEGEKKPDVNPDAIFQHTAEPGITVISIPMYVKCRSYQIRFKRYCYRTSGEITAAQVEYGTKQSI